MKEVEIMSVSISRSDHPSRLKSDAILLLVAVIWGSGFIAQRVAAEQLGFFVFNGARFLLGVLTVWLFNRNGWKDMTKAEVRGGALAGFLIFIAASLQQAGIAFTTAGKAGFITGLYVVLVPILLAIFWKRGSSFWTWLASLIAVAGMFLLTMEGAFTLAFGDALVLIGALMWALHVIVIDLLTKKVNVIRLAMMQFLVAGVLSTVFGIFLEWPTIANIPNVWWTILYGGIISVGIGYTLQLVGQKGAPATDSAIILSMESVFAAIFGGLLLSEELTWLQIGGCVLMLAGMLLAQVATFSKSSG
jgi:drug/metabolite transporter (DMT)-like permease